MSSALIPQDKILIVMLYYNNINIMTSTITETDKAVSHITKRVSGKKIWIFHHRLLEIVKPEIQQDIINAIINPDISRRSHTPCKAKRKKNILTNTASESSSGSDSESESGSDSVLSIDGMCIHAVKAKKRN